MQSARICSGTKVRQTTPISLLGGISQHRNHNLHSGRKEVGLRRASRRAHSAGTGGYSLGVSLHRRRRRLVLPPRARMAHRIDCRGTSMLEFHGGCYCRRDEPECRMAELIRRGAAS